MPIRPSLALRPLALASALVLLAGLSADADAQRRGAPAAPTACTDFYSFTNQDWLAENATEGPGIVTASALQELQALALRQQRQLLDSAMNAPQNEVQQLLGNFWASGLDEAAVEADGAQPIATLLSRIDGIRRARDVPPTIAALHQVGIPVAFEFNADVDLADLGRHIGYFSQGGLGLPDAAYYGRDDDDTRAVMDHYRDYVRNILALTGVEEAALDAETGAVIDLESQIAAYWRDVEHMRDPRNNYALVPTADLRRQYRRLQLDQFLQAQGVEGDSVSMANPQLFALLDNLVANAGPAQWKSYLRFQVGNAMAPYLSQSFRDAEFEFHGRVLRGEAAPAARTDQVLAAINKAAGPMLAREYVAAHLPAATGSRAEAIAGQVRDALVRGLDRADWLDEATKGEARRKLQALRIEIGAPVQDLDFTVQPMGRSSFGANMLIASTWRHGQEMRRIGQDNASRRWDVLPQQPALAYDLAQNRLIVSAAVLQPPVLDMASEDPAAHYGSYGALVGHELGRSIDILGRMVDADGNVRDWWTRADEAAWTDRSHRLAAQYHAYPFPNAPDSMVDGTRTRDANAADLAGLELAWDALQAASPELPKESSQHFFQAWAQLWRQQMSPDAAAVAAASQAQAPGQWRGNGPLANLPAFGTAFDCKPGTAMQRAEDDQVRIWR